MTARLLTLAELRRLAENATPGPWEWDDDHARPGLRHGRSFGGVLFRCGALYGPDAADAAFIAAANPAVVLALLAEREALAAKVERVRALGDHWLRLSGTSMTDEVREWTLAAGLSIRAALDGAES